MSAFESLYTVEVVNQIKIWFLSNLRLSNESGILITEMPLYSVREHLRSTSLLFIAINAVIFIVGLSLNVLLLAWMIKGRLYRDRSMLFVSNIALCDLLQLTFVLPYTLCIILFEHWVMGRVLCYAGPWAQHLPVSVTTLTYLMLALYRHRQIVNPLQERFSARLSIAAIWVVAGSINLPLCVFYRFIDLQVFWKHYIEPFYVLSLKADFFEGVHMCAQAVKQSLRDFARAFFILLFVTPFGVAAFLHVRTSAELSSDLRRLHESGASPETLALRRTDQQWDDEVRDEPLSSFKRSRSWL